MPNDKNLNLSYKNLYESCVYNHLKNNVSVKIVMWSSKFKKGVIFKSLQD